MCHFADIVMKKKANAVTQTWQRLLSFSSGAEKDGDAEWEGTERN